MLENMLYDRIINIKIEYKAPIETSEALPNVVFTNADTDETYSYTSAKSYDRYKTFSLTCPTSGIKPNIKVQWKRVPAHFCYDCTIEIANLYLPINAIWAERLWLTMGYRSKTIDIACTVFASYQSSPGPDGITTFRCITASADLALFAEQPYSLTVLHSSTKKFTLRDVLLELQTQLKKFDSRAEVITEPKGPSETSTSITTVTRTYDSEDDEDGDYNEVITQEEVQSVKEIRGSNIWLAKTFAPNNFETQSYQGVYALVNAIQTQFNASLKDDKVSVQALIFDHKIIFSFLEEGQGIIVRESKGEASELSGSEIIPVLDIVSSASWNAGTLTVTAPWNPDIIPGSLFLIDPAYYTGGDALPNSVARAGLQKDAYDIYYVITQEVTFSTHEDNQMVLMAVPMKNSPKQLATTSTDDTIKLNSKIPETIIDEYYAKANPIIPILLTAKDASGQTQPPKKLEDCTLDMTSVDYTITVNDRGLSYIIENKDESRQLPDLPPLKAHFVNENHIYTIAGYKVWYPVIVILTYTYYKQDTNGHKLYKIDIRDPDAIKAGNRLKIPKGYTWKSLQSSMKSQLVPIFKEYMQFYIDLKKDSWAADLQLAYKLLDEGVIVE